MARTYSILVHFERDDFSVSHSTMSGSELTGVIASSEEEAIELAEAKVIELDGHSFDFV